MFILFFTIVFIAQIIVTHWFVSMLIKLDNRVCEINQTISGIDLQFKNKLISVRTIIKAISDNLDCFNTFVEVKKKDCQKALQKNLITSIIFFVLNLPGKRILTIIDIILMIKKVYTGLKK